MTYMRMPICTCYYHAVNIIVYLISPNVTYHTAPPTIRTCIHFFSVHVYIFLSTCIHLSQYMYTFISVHVRMCSNFFHPVINYFNIDHSTSVTEQLHILPQTITLTHCSLIHLSIDINKYILQTEKVNI